MSRNPGLDSLEPKSISELTTILTETRRELKQMQEEADEIRDIHHDKVYEKAAELHHKDKMTVMRKVWGRDFVHHNELANTFHNNQYGGRKRRTTNISNIE